MPNTVVPIQRALLSVFDKTGIEEFAKELARLGVELVSTGGTARLIAGTGAAVRDIADLTGFPEMMDGRVKTLHPKVHGGLLAVRDNPTHKAALEAHQIGPIDLVVVNLYPFEATIAKGASYDETIENIDIGGPAMIRSAAKNHAYVTVLVDPNDYAPVLEAMRQQGGVPYELRQKLAAKAYARTAAYDSVISNWFAQTLGYSDIPYRTFGGRLAEVMRYGENPHQWAAFYSNGDTRPGVATATQVQGKSLSYNNLNDTDAAFELISEFDPAVPAVAIIKHANPCGVATGTSLADAYQKAFRCDPVSAFGGIVALNQEIDATTAGEITKIFTEVIVAPAASAEAQKIIATKKNLRLLLTGSLADPKAAGLTFKSLAGGMLVQSRDSGRINEVELKVVTHKQPSAAELADLKLAMTVAKHVKSNAIVYVKDGATVGIGAGQMSRVDSSRIAHRKSVDAAQAAGLDEALTKGSVVASDAFFPFPDGMLAAVEAGATAVIQPGGSVNDQAVIDAANEKGVAMVLTGMRHFRH
ncbi:MAG: bifunctional phosphoribosylaminoimidazolecarboxamide formyltransferase/IMP cyclohydrolase [Devosia sp. 67-54]|uniref:bifunctional phosphoribosylaminoimidazolecarboxamide formyltransferase/IMP cyclohydrolase n=1 Tax=unclassified Devosia TaxID=196773 RepID=UPI00095AE773|nr:MULTISPECIES: bifunctional phosphoribosylaminoimidazolecarboxamide formyltransferase/IMP cyclohydrolase [unclassified Devosia]MBN9307124.1 bifunctional phosphoribosylaminoimidazolecarboxamide formyltransferase/IMP cyclohydrolase [Devosia sp.]OJX19524.1 MAG: bifunctional phosphoribosylaminoimidazolecarboxamide formyltransferase/IMP cyclohydrolase [Devosia sp. 67-54]